MATDLRQIVLVQSDSGRRARLASVLSSQFGWCSVAESLEMMGARPYIADVIIMELDAVLTSSVGNTIQRIQSRQENAAVILLTHNPAITRSAFLAGAQDCLPVGATDDEVVDSINRVVNRPPRATEPTGVFDTRPINHSEFLRELSRLRDDARCQCQNVTIIMADLDRFRDCNERFSSTFADGVLRWFASRLRATAPTGSVVGCMGSDRFAVATPASRADVAVRQTERLHHLLHESPIQLQDNQFELGASIGVAQSTTGFVETEQQLLQRARMATDHAKKLGGKRTVTWNSLVSQQLGDESATGHPLRQSDNWLQRTREQLRDTYIESTRALVAAAEARDPFTKTHSVTVATYAETIAQRLGLGGAMIDSLRVASLLHDIGKIGIPDSILTKPGPLTAQEFEVVKKHPQIGVDILQHARYLENERPLILHHHERYDGRGYPKRLKGEAIPIGARILAVADSLDVMFSSRSYKPPFPLERVRAELQAEAGKQFDPVVASAALQWLDAAPDNREQTAKVWKHSVKRRR